MVAPALILMFLTRACEIIYKETINNTVNGYGHFEPLKHYAEVHLKLESLPRGSGIIFKNKCIS